MSPAYVYQNVSNPYAQSIGELMQRRGDIDARAAENVGQIRARAAEMSGQIASQAAQAIGQQVAAIPGQIQQQKHQALVDADIASQVKERNAQAAAREAGTRGLAAVDKVIQDSMTPDPETGVVSFHRDKFEQGLAQSGQGHLYPQYAEMLDKLDKSSAERNAKTRELTAQTLYGISQAGYTPESVTLGAAYLKANGVATDSHLSQVFGQIGPNATPETIKPVIEQMSGAMPEYRKLTEAEEKRKADLGKTLADTGKANADAAKTNAEVSGTMPVTPVQKSEIDLKNKQIEEINAKLSGNEPLTPYQKQELQIQRDRLKAENERADPQSESNQQKLEQQYRTVLQRAIGARTGGLGLEDQKVNQANHLTSLLDQFYNAKTGTWDIPRVQLNELALGLARLTSPGGQAGEGMLREFQQRTAKGDLAGALTYLTGQPVPTNTQSITKMLKESIERQGKTAEQNRQGGLDYLRGLVPTDLNENRRQQLESTSMTPLRQSRVIQNTNSGERKLQVSVDGGKTWQ